MKSSVARLIFATLIASSTTIANSRAEAARERRANSDMVSIEAVDLFVPNGFDANDEIIVVLDGYLPNSCFRLTRPEVNVDKNSKQITVNQMARKFPGPCLVTLVPFTNIIPVGALEAGEWVVSTNHGILTEDLHVAPDTSSNGQFGPDSFLYAPVDTVSVASRGENKFEARISGRFTNSCMKILEVKALSKGRVIELLPVLDDQAMQGADCAAAEKPFSKSVKLPEDLEIGRNLVHVRSLNGNSVNAVFSVDP